MALGEDQGGGLEGGEDRGGAFGDIARGYEDGEIFGGLVELGDGEGADGGFVAAFEGFEVVGVAAEAFEAMLLGGLGAFDIEAGLLGVFLGGEYDGGGEEGEPGQEEEPARIEDGPGMWCARGHGREFIGARGLGCGAIGARPPYTRGVEGLGCGLMSRRVVITGLGVVTGHGVGMEPLWEALCAGRSALRPIGRFDASGFPCRLAAEVPEPFSAKDFVPKHYRKAVKVMARDIELAVAAASRAVGDARVATRGTLAEDATEKPTYPGSRMGCQIGAGLIAAEADELTGALATARREGGAGLDLKAWGRTGMDALTPLWLLKYLPNMLACHVTIIHGCEGPSNTITCAEASGLLSIAESARVIERGDADMGFAGGAESKVNLMGLLRMDFAGRVAHTGSATDGGPVVRPFDPASAGGLLGEGAGLLVLEAHETAMARGARVYAEIIGQGAGHSPWREAGAMNADEGYQAAVENALDDAGLRADDIDAIVPAGMGIPTMDAGEAGALRSIFGARLAEVPLVTLAPSIGNTMAGWGGLQAAVAAKCVFEQRLPARLHGGTPGAGLQAGAAAARGAALRHVLVATGASGGQNAALILRRG